MRLTLRTRLALTFATAVAGALVVFSLAVVLIFAVAESNEAAREGSAVTQAELREDAGRVLLSMVLVAPLAIGGATALGLWFARRAVAPLREATARVRAAQASDLKLTLPVQGTGDEWDELAVTLNALLADASGSMQRIRRFTADAAHELRTPLTAIIGEVEVTLRREREKEALRGSLSVVGEQAARLSGVLNALLMLARADAGTLLARQAPCALDEIVRTAVEQALADARRAGLAEPTVVVEGQAGSVQGDEVLLVQAVRNVVENGLHHGGGTVTILMREEDSAACVRIADAGPGVPLSIRSTIFERFTRGDEARSGSGLGLGLAIASAIADAHRGKLALVPSEAGATFELRLPRVAR